MCVIMAKYILFQLYGGATEIAERPFLCASI